MPVSVEFNVWRQLLLLAAALLVATDCPLAKTEASPPTYSAYGPRSCVEITVIESKHHGLLVATGEQNYAMLSPALKKHNWTAISVNENRILVHPANGTLKKLGHHGAKIAQRFLEPIRHAFYQNLEGLAFSKICDSQNEYSSSSSAPSGTPPAYSEYISPPVSSYSSGGYNRAPSQHYHAGQCKPQTVNYYNLHSSALKHKLHGDVYHLGLSAKVIDVWTSTMSHYSEDNMFILYRDLGFFIFARPGLPKSISGFLVIGNQVFFFYNNNATVLVKSSSMLDSVERNMVQAARAQVKRLVRYLDNEPHVVTSKPTTSAPTHEPATHAPTKLPLGLPAKVDHLKHHHHSKKEPLEQLGERLLEQPANVPLVKLSASGSVDAAGDEGEQEQAEEIQAEE